MLPRNLCTTTHFDNSLYRMYVFVLSRGTLANRFCCLLSTHKFVHQAKPCSCTVVGILENHCLRPIFNLFRLSTMHPSCSPFPYYTVSLFHPQHRHLRIASLLSHDWWRGALPPVSSHGRQRSRATQVSNDFVRPRVDRRRDSGGWATTRRRGRKQAQSDPSRVRRQRGGASRRFLWKRVSVRSSLSSGWLATGSVFPSDDRGHRRQCCLGQWLVSIYLTATKYGFLPSYH